MVRKTKITTSYLYEDQLNWFDNHPEISRSAVMRQVLDDYIKKRK